MPNTDTTTETPGLTAGTWTVEPAHSEVGFTVRHLGLSKVRGRFNAVEGTVAVADVLADSSIEVVVDLASVDTNNADRDQHLRSTDFFDTDTHPQMRFASTGIDVGPDGRTGTVAGDLTLNGVTRAIELDAEFGGVGVDPFGITRAGFSATATVNRKDFGIDFQAPLDAGSLLVGDKVNVEIEVQLVPAG